MSTVTLISGIKGQCFVEEGRFISVALLIWKITRDLWRLGLMNRERFSIMKSKLALDYFFVSSYIDENRDRLFRCY